MKIGLEIDENLIVSVDRAAAIRGCTRDEAIREAIAEWIPNQPKHARWPEDLLNWKGDPDFPRFELDRPVPESSAR